MIDDLDVVVDCRFEKALLLSVYPDFVDSTGDSSY